MDRSLVFEPGLYAHAKTFIERCTAARLRIGTAESCTGGLLAALLTEVPGAAEVFDLGVVSYAYSAKEQILGVPHQTLEQVGADKADTPETNVSPLSGELRHTSSDGYMTREGVETP